MLLSTCLGAGRLLHAVIPSSDVTPCCRGAILCHSTSGKEGPAQDFPSGFKRLHSANELAFVLMQPLLRCQRPVPLGVGQRRACAEFASGLKELHSANELAAFALC